MDTIFLSAIMDALLLIDSKNATEADINELENCSTSKRKRSFFNKLFNK